MQLTKASSKSSQVTAFIRHKIQSGELAAGAKLQSVRNLAEEFNVGRQVVLSAFSILEREKLIHMKARQGAFVMERSAKAAGRGIYFLAYCVNEGNKYLESLLRLTYPPCLKEGHNFFTRIIPSGLASEELLDVELKRIKDTPGLDAVIIHAANFERKQIEKCLTLPRPVLFVGDFNKGKFPDIALNQMVSVSDSPERCLRHLVDRGNSNIVLFVSSLKYAYNANLAGAAKKTAKDWGIDLTVIDFPTGIHSLPRAKRDKLALSVIKQHMPANFGAAFSAGANFEMLKNAMAALDINIYKDLDFITAEENVENITCLEYDYSNMFENIYSQLDRLFENKGVGERCEAKVECKIVKTQTLTKRRETS